MIFSPRKIHHSDTLKHYLSCESILKKKNKGHLQKGEEIIRLAQVEAEKIIQEVKEKSDKILHKANKKFEQGFETGQIEGKTKSLQKSLTWLCKLEEMKTLIFNEMQENIVNSVGVTVQQVINESASQFVTAQLKSVLSSLDFDENIELHAAKALLENIDKKSFSYQKLQYIEDNELGKDECFLLSRYFKIDISMKDISKKITSILRTA